MDCLGYMASKLSGTDCAVEDVRMEGTGLGLLLSVLRLCNDRQAYGAMPPVSSYWTFQRPTINPAPSSRFRRLLASLSHDSSQDHSTTNVSLRSRHW